MVYIYNPQKAAIHHGPNFVIGANRYLAVTPEVAAWLHATCKQVLIEGDKEFPSPFKTYNAHAYRKRYNESCPS